MTFQERALYHQIHPLKLAVDILATLPALYLLWRHELVWGLVVTFVPSIIITAILLRWARLEWLRDSAFGRYLARNMSQLWQGMRVLGLLVMMVGAWAHLWALIPLGLLVVLVAWLRGLLRPRQARAA